MYTFICIDLFDKCQHKYNIDDSVLFDVQKILIEDMFAGDLIPNTGGAYKVRVGLDSKGKRGGCRVIYIPRKDKLRIYLCMVYPKNKKTNLTKDEEDDIKQYVKDVFNENVIMFMEGVGMSFFEDLKEAYKEIHEYEKNGTCGRELEPITAFAEGAKLKIKESDSFVEKTAVVIKPNGKISIVHTDAFSTNDELIEEYERYDHEVISVYDGYVNDSELLSE